MVTYTHTLNQPMKFILYLFLFSSFIIVLYLSICSFIHAFTFIQLYKHLTVCTCLLKYLYIYINNQMSTYILVTRCLYKCQSPDVYKAQRCYKYLFPDINIDVIYINRQMLTLMLYILVTRFLYRCQSPDVYKAQRCYIYLFPDINIDVIYINPQMLTLMLYILVTRCQHGYATILIRTSFVLTKIYSKFFYVHIVFIFIL